MSDFISQSIAQIEAKIKTLHAEALQYSQKQTNAVAELERKKQQIEASYAQTKKNLSSQESAAESAYRTRIGECAQAKKDAEARAATARSQYATHLKAKYDREYQGAKARRDFFLQYLSEFPSSGAVQKASAEPNAVVCRDFYAKIKDPTFVAKLKRLLKIGGYYGKKKMSSDFADFLESARLYYEDYLKQLLATYRAESAKPVPGVEAQLKRELASAEATRQSAEAEYTRKKGELGNAYSSAANQYRTSLAGLESEKQTKAAELQRERNALVQRRTAFLQSPLISGFGDGIRASLKQSGAFAADWVYDPLHAEIGNFALGSYFRPIVSPSKSLPQEIEKAIPKLFRNNAFIVPMIFPTAEVQRFFYQYETAVKGRVAEQIQYYILQKLRCAPPDSYTVYFIDPDDRGRSLGILTESDEKNAEIGLYMRNTREGISATFKEIVRMIDRMAGLLQGESSVARFNLKNKEQRIKETVLVLNDADHCLTQDLLHDFKTIWENAERCGISILMSSAKPLSSFPSLFPHAPIDPSFLSLKGVYHVACTTQGAVLEMNGSRYSYQLCSLGDEQRAFLKKYRNPFAEENEGKVVNPLVVNDFRRLFKDLFDKTVTPLPDGKVDESYSLRTDRLFTYPQNSAGEIKLPVCIPAPLRPPLVAENFEFGASTTMNTLVTGTAGSGKSSFLHMMIMSVILNYHPDDVEMWLLDYGKVEFKPYLTRRPPHVRMISLEKTEEFTYSFLEYLNGKIREREKIFLNAGVSNLSEYRRKFGALSMPRIFLIVDEFHVMTQHIKYSSAHRAMLENVLTEGRKFGISCLFSNQTLSALDGLTETARSQIGNRIAMKGNVIADVKETLAVPANYYTDDLTDKMMQLKGDGDYLFRDALFNIRAYKAIYISNGVRAEILDAVIARNIPVQQDTEVFVINGNERVPLPKREIASMLRGQGENGMEMHLGIPTTIEKHFSFRTERKYNNNILIAGRDSVMASDILHSIMFSLLQNPRMRVAVLAEETDEKYRMFLKVFKSLDPALRVEMHDDYDDLCGVINTMHAKIVKKEQLENPTVFFWLGLKDMFDEFNVCAPKPEGDSDVRRTDSEGDAAFDFGQLLAEIDGADTSEDTAPHVQSPERAAAHPARYNAIKDILDLFKLGSRYGLYHVVPLEFSGDVRYCKGLQLDQFLHKIALCMARDESAEWGLRAMASELSPDLTALYTDGIVKKTFRPYKTNE